MKKIVFQGEPGANSHIACKDVFPDYEAVPCATFEDSFAALLHEEAHLAMIPIENSVAGRVADIHHLLPTAGLHIIGEYFLPIRHQLMALPDASRETIQYAHSHIHALGQCRHTLRELGLIPIVGADTAGSAREVGQGDDIRQAAIASRLAAEIYGLKILAEDIEDEAHNTTRFIILSKDACHASLGSGSLITTFVFRVRNVPAALYKALGGFATNGVNMMKLESYQLEGRFFASQFLAEVEGHPEEPALKLALEELAFYSVELTVLGVYPASEFRRNISEPESNRALRPSPHM